MGTDRILVSMNTWEPERDGRDPWVEGVLGFAWMFIAGLMVCASGAVMMIALGTHLLLRVRPDATRVVDFDPSTVATVAFVPVAGGVLLGVLYLRRLRRYRSGGA